MTALAATVRKLTTMVDGTVRVTMDFDASREVMEMCGTPGTTVAVAMLTAEAARESLVSDSITNVPENVPNSVTYGDEAAKLKLSGFCDRIEVMQALGGDKAFLAWIRTQEKCVARSFEHANPANNCAGDIVAAHVRRIAKGAGTGKKPEYSAVPMCDFHHTIQRQQGESAVGGKEHLDKESAKYLDKFGWWALKKTLGYASMRDVPPKVLHDWAFEHGLVSLLPPAYQEA